MESKPIAVCFALKEEAAPFQKLCADKMNISIFLTGIGRENAEKSAREFLKNCSPEFLLTCGFAGGLNPELKIGDVVFEVQSPKSKVQSQLLAAGAKPAKIFCADKIATTVAEKKQLREETGADAAEMESAAVQAVCRERGILCATVRVISDAADDDLPLDFNQFLKRDKSMDMGKLFFTVAKSPGKIGALMKLQKQTQFAAGQLAAILDKIIFQ